MAKAPVISPIYAWVLDVGLVAGVTSFLAWVVSPLGTPGAVVVAAVSGIR